MAISYRSSSSANTGSTSASSLAINVPAGIVPGDVMIACFGSSNGGSAVVVNGPSGATWKTLINIEGSSGMNLTAFSRVVTGYEAASYTFTFASSCQASGVIVDYSGAYNFNPVTFGSSSTGTASTTTVSSAPGASYFSGQTIQLFGALNTTATSTMTANGSFTQRIDTCTTGSEFVEVCAQDAVRSGSINSTTSAAATISQSATSTALTIFMEGPRSTFSGLVQDEAYGNSWSSAVSSFTTPTFDLFTTNYYNEVLLAFINLRQGTNTVSGVTSSNGLTWVNVGRANTNAGSVEVWRILVATPSQFTVTATLSGSTASGDYVIVGFVGADMTGTSGSGAIGALSTGTSSSAAPSIAVTTTRNGSWVWGAANDPSHNTSFAAGSGQTLVRSSTDGTNGCSSGTGQQTSVTGTAGTNVTMNFTSPSADSCNVLAVEILPAIHYNLGAMGAG